MTPCGDFYLITIKKINSKFRVENFGPLTAQNKIAYKNLGVTFHKKLELALMGRRRNLLGTPRIAFIQFMCIMAVYSSVILKCYMRIRDFF
jgi:hypothetical protein